MLLAYDALWYVLWRSKDWIMLLGHSKLETCFSLVLFEKSNEAWGFFLKPFFGYEKSIARSRLNRNKKYIHFGHFALSNTIKKKIDEAHFLDARGNEEQVSNLEWPKWNPHRLDIFTTQWMRTFVQGPVIPDSSKIGPNGKTSVPI